MPGYEVSDHGRVRNARTGRILRPSNYKLDGYLRIETSHRRVLLHRLVLEAFVGPCPPGCEARHVHDPDRGNCRLSNLAWGTKKENADDRWRQGRAPGRPSAVHVGARYGQLLVRARAASRGRNSSWECVCDCGRVHVARADLLVSGETWRCLSCAGLLRRLAAVGTLALALLASACVAPAEPDDWGDGDQVTLDVRVDWSGRGVPDGGWDDAGPVVVEADAGDAVGTSVAALDGRVAVIPHPLDGTPAPCAGDAPEPLPELVGTYCGADGGEWLFTPRSPLVVWRDGVRREGSATVEPGRITVRWLSACTSPADCVEVHGSSFYALVVGDGWLDVDDERLTYEWRGCP